MSNIQMIAHQGTQAHGWVPPPCIRSGSLLSRRNGYRREAVIVGSRIDPDGALAGGTARSRPHCSKRPREPGCRSSSARATARISTGTSSGLDAAVSKRDGFRQTLAFHNDTDESIVVRTVSRPGIAWVDLYAQTALGRRVAFSQPAISHRQHADDRHIRSASLPRGQHRRVEPASDGMTVIVISYSLRGARLGSTLRAASVKADPAGLLDSQQCDRSGHHARR